MECKVCEYSCGCRETCKLKSSECYQNKQTKCMDYVSNQEAYPLCKGIGEEKCHNCCLYENYEEYHSPYPEQ